MSAAGDGLDVTGKAPTSVPGTLTLFDVPDPRPPHTRPRNPIARATDPWTSHAAARDVTKSGRRATQAQKVLDALVAYGPCTSIDLAAAARLDRYVVARRLPELQALGLVVQGEARPARVNGRNAVVWRAL